MNSSYRLLTCAALMSRDREGAVYGHFVTRLIFIPAPVVPETPK